MKLGLALAGTTIETLAAQAVAAEAVGIELAWLQSPADEETALMAAAAVAARTSVLRLAACARIGDHPLAIAEAAAVADNCSGGRLILVLEDDRGDAELLAETTDVVLAAIAPRPFRHEGPRWRIPANLPENDQHEERIILTPQAVQTELPVWLLGPSAAEVARARALSHVALQDDGVDAMRGEWQQTEGALGPAAARPRRPAVRLLDADDRGEIDADGVVAQLRADQRAWSMDTAILKLPAGLDEAAFALAARRIATRVRPRVTMDELPPGIESHWKEVLV
jgi:alkanesulfonate monooxygenase SsuD/methylene tetrahydromethanopterin reductase-like flavin-dependent oxidoreductase (luciferase family)